MKNNRIKASLGVLAVLSAPIVVNAVCEKEIYAAQGWIQNGSTWYYYNQSGSLVKNAWVGNYWLGADGKMATNSWVDNNKYYVGNDGSWVKNAKKPEEKKVGWQKEGSTWYYYNQSGSLVKNAWVGNYWLGADGKMSTNSWVDNNKYYVGNDGSWVKNAKKPEEKKVGWQKEGSTWYYYNQSGSLVKNAWAGNYWLGADGKMATNSWVDNNKYYVGNDGSWVKNAKKPEEKKVGWQKEGSTWYYYNQSGTLVKNAWAGNYWLGADGKMATNSWVDNSKYYVGNDGSWVKNAKKPEEKKVGWQKEGSTWYYYNQSGTLVKNAWAGNYWLGADGKMATNSWIDNSKYYVGSDGSWIKNFKITSSDNRNLNKVLDIARDYLGVKSGSNEHRKIIDAYNSINPKPVGYTAKYSDDWCDIFITTVFQQAGLSNLIGRECGVQRHINILQQKGIWQGKSLPKQGDIVTFDWDGGGWADHIGIVESVNNGMITTIEGNSADYVGSKEKTKVNRKTYDWNSRYIKGYARPVY
ncbi:N-acetylmuramoyl-L-alanine amidase [Gemella cuniculi]